MPEQYRNVPRTIEAHKYDGTNNDVQTLRDWGAYVDVDSEGDLILTTGPGTIVIVDENDWIIRTDTGHIAMTDDEFQQEYVERTPADRDELRFKMNLTSGSIVDVAIGGLANGRDGVYTLMQLARPETILEYIKQQTIAGDMSMIGLVDELAALANPGE